ncbi:hypothetical protein BCE75_10150 [Isoptericola sp. CG 20/1183]|uniref:Uncharacterized protein n=1 Tax=Isoptericola halotolerans TaxID=300560 RepID=A0ABX5EJJ7_9MICO|nr:hypothetical protein BCL65_102372 [Isoptericola halotolerans]PRZ10728.1 hypothetical protein BCE75_10150 [Isoptericola sp. CG 20/1183]
MAVSARCRAVSRSCSVTAEISSGKSRARSRSSAMRAASFRAQATLEASLRTVVSRMFVVGQLPPALTAIWKDEARARRPLASAVGGALSALLAWRQISSASASGSRSGPESSSGSSSSGEGSAVGRSAPASAVGKGSSTCWSREFSGRSTPLPGLIRVGPASVDVDIGSGVADDVGGSESQPASARPMATMEVQATPALIGSSDRLACGVRRTPDSRYRRERAPARGRGAKSLIARTLDKALVYGFGRAMRAANILDSALCCRTPCFDFLVRGEQGWVAIKVEAQGGAPSEELGPFLLGGPG